MKPLSEFFSEDPQQKKLYALVELPGGESIDSFRALVVTSCVIPNDVSRPLPCSQLSLPGPVVDTPNNYNNSLTIHYRPVYHSDIVQHQRQRRPYPSWSSNDSRAAPLSSNSTNSTLFPTTTPFRTLQNPLMTLYCTRCADNDVISFMFAPALLPPTTTCRLCNHDISVLSLPSLKPCYGRCRLRVYADSM